MRLIDADQLIHEIKTSLWDWKSVDGITATTVLKQTISDIENQPTVLPEKQEEIVRCKDCRHRDPEDHKCDCGHDIQWQLPRADNWFCADGEEK